MTAFPQSFSSSNRPTGPSSISPSNQFDDISSLLENTPKKRRGSKEKPSVIKFPLEIGTGEVPHVMQFKVFWRWPRPQFIKANSVKLENEKKLQIDKTTLGAFQIAENLTEPVLAIGSQTIDIKSAKLAAEQNVSNTTKVLRDIQSEIDRGDGRIVLSEDDEKQRNLGMKVASIRDGIGDGLINDAGSFGVKVSVGVASLAVPTLAPVLKPVADNSKSIAKVVHQGIIDTVVNLAVFDQMVSIYLPVCTKINNEDTFQYEEAEMKTLNALSDIVNGGSVVDSVVQAGSLAIDAKYGDSVRQAKTALRGTVVNPRLEKLFKSKDFRSFSFAWEFYPKSKKETEIIKDIIETFRYHAHPSVAEQIMGEKDSNVEIMLRVPAEFEIRFLSTNPNPSLGGFVDNEYIPKITRCVINSVSVDYTPQGLFATFEDNAPVAITLTISVTEIEVLLRDKIESGY